MDDLDTSVPLDVALIGYGAIGRYVHAHLSRENHAQVAPIVMRPERVAAIQDEVGDGASVVASMDDLPTTPGLVVEAAGHAGLAEHGVAAAASGFDRLCHQYR